MKQCPNCGAQVSDTAKFCAECGESLIQQIYVCPGCKIEYTGGKFCPECGKPLIKQASFAPSEIGNAAPKPKRDELAVCDEKDEAELAKYAEEKMDYAEMDAAYGGQLKEKDGKIAQKTEYDKKVVKARTYAIRGMYDEAKAIYDGFIEDDPTDMNGYMGLIRIESKNYTEYEGEEIGKAIRVAKQIYGGGDIGECDPDYAAYSANSEKYFAEKAEAERKAEEARRAEEERIAQEEAERKAKEEAELKTRETVKGRSLAIRGMYDEAKAVYNAIIDADPADMNGYIGLIRVAAKNYTEYEGEEIEETIRIAKQMGGEEIGQYDPDYATYAARREKYFADKAEEERKAEENRKAREEAAKPHKNGNTINFGLWPQSAKANDVTIGFWTDEDGYYTGSDGERYAKVGDKYFKVEPIEWQILNECNGEALIVSNAILANMAYHGSKNNYANSDVRKWLNGEFYDKAFTAESKKYIETSLVDNSVKSTGYSSNSYACKNTNDKVFLLSYEEAFNKYGLTDSSRQKKPTEYAKATGARVDSDKRSKSNGNGWWWLRSPNYDDDEARGVYYGGSVNCYYVYISYVGVVPALLIRLNKCLRKPAVQVKPNVNPLRS